jgi:hypothetical protein
VQLNVSLTPEPTKAEHDDSKELPATLTLDEAYRSAFYLVLDYFRRGHEDPKDVVLLLQSMWTDPARWHDWQAAIRRALEDGGVADPDHEGRWQVRPDFPK